MKKILAAGIILGFFCIRATSCTCGAVHGTACFDGRAIAWKNRDISGITQKLFFKVGPRFPYLAVGGSDTRMGLNSQGLALGHSIVQDLGVSSPNNVKNHDYILGNLCSLSQCTTAFSEQTRGIATYYGGAPSMTTPIVDGFGNAIHLEVGHTVYVTNEHGDTVPPFFRYDPLDYGPGKARKQPVVVRTNYTHKNSGGQDDSTSSDKRFLDGRNNLQNAVVRKGILNTDSLGGNGVTIQELIQVARYGNPGTGAYRTTCGLSTRCAMLAHTVNAGEDPRIAVMWVAQGNPDYAPFIPVWVENGIKGDLLSFQTTTITDSLHHFCDYAIALYNRRDSSDYDKYVNERLEPMEANFIDITYQARARWFEKGFTYHEAKSIYTYAATTGWQTLKTISNQSAIRKRPLNGTPIITNITAGIQGLTITLSHNGIDQDGRIVKTFWDFGDGTTSEEAGPKHSYASGGTYLVMCQVTDDSGSCNARWRYVDLLSSNTEQSASARMAAIQIMPNPFKSTAKFIVEGAAFGGKTHGEETPLLRMYDINSRLVQVVGAETPFSRHGTQYEYILDAQRLPSGVYFVTARIQSQLYKSKFILQK